MTDDRLNNRDTDRAALEEAAETLRRLSSALETMQMGVTIADVDGRIVYTNRADADMHGYTVEELAGKDVGIFAAEGQRHQLTLSQLRALKSWKREALNVRKDGTVFPAELLSDVVRRADGEPIGVVTTCQDITDRKRVEEAVARLREREREMLEAQLRHAQKLEELGRLTGGIAHDFNNILSVIIANTEFAMAVDPARRDELTAFLGEIDAAAESGAKLVEQLLGFGRRSPLNVKPCDLRRVVQDLSSMLRRLIPADIAMELDTDADVPQARADTNAVQQMLANLVTNARDAMPDGGAIRIAVRHGVPAADGPGLPGAEPSVCIAVSDTGTGMDEGTKARVFEPFFTTKAPGKGTGLGLAMVAGLIREHEGAVRIESAQGAGTTVELHFPAEHTAAAAVESTAEPTGAPCRGTGTILLAEDNAGLRRAARRALEMLGYRVLAAADGEQALMLYRAHEAEIDLVLSDVVMPRLGGGDLYRAVRQQNGSVKFLLASGYAPEDVEARGALEPGVPFMQKPWTLAQLAERVHELLKEGPGDGPEAVTRAVS